ncbi:MAG: hypothetical protein WA373_11000 [Burkholderiales bacterium]
MSAAACAHAGDTGFAVKGGTLGGGLDITAATSETVNLRANLNGYKYNKNFTESDIDYKGALDLRTAGLLLDWHPGGGWFRLSGGAYWNGNKLTLNGQPSAAATYDINGTTYAGSDVGSLAGTVNFPSVAPYVGIGFDAFAKKKSGFSFTLDIGLLYQRSPSVSLTATCGSALPTVTCNQLQSDVAAEQVQLQDSVKSFRNWPVVALGIGYKF